MVRSREASVAGVLTEVAAPHPRISEERPRHALASTLS